MLFLSGRILGTSAPPRTVREFITKNALVEAFALHLRVLLAFLYSDRQRSDDVCADEFVLDDEAWRRALPAKPESLKTAQQRTGGEIAHLTSRRITGTPPEKGWHLRLVDDLR